MFTANPSHKVGRCLSLMAISFVLGFGAAQLVNARDSGIHAEKILVTSKTVIDEVIRYPHGGPHPKGGRAEITAQVVTLEPGAATPWHRHPMPTFGYILSGEIEVDYGKKGRKTFRQGEALMEAMAHTHRGRNVSNKPVRLLAVSIGEQGQPTSVSVPAAQP